MLFQVPEVGHMSLSLEEWGTEMYGASHLTAHEWHLHAFMGIYKHVSSMLGNFTSHYFFKKSLLNSFTFPSTVPKALSQQNNAFFCVLQCVWHGDRSVAKAIDALDLVVAMDFAFSCVQGTQTQSAPAGSHTLTAKLRTELEVWDDNHCLNGR